MIRIAALTGFVFCCVIDIFAQVEVVVTASRVEEDARSTPAYVRVIPEEVVQRGRDVLDALRSIPDISIVSTSPGKEYISMGGFGENGFARTLVLVDGNPVNRTDMSSINWTSIPLGQIERIEVVKGPMSSQLGDQAVAGAINIITKKPDGWESSIKIDYDVGLLGNNQEMFFSYGGSRFQLDTVMNHKTIESSRKNSRSEAVTANIGLAAAFGSLNTDLSFRYNYVHNNLPGDLSKEEYDTNPDMAKNDDEAKNTLLGLDLAVNLDLDAVNFKSTVFWNDRIISNDNMTYSSWSDTNYDEVGGTVQASADFLLGDTLVLNTVGGIDTRWSRINVKVYEDSSRDQASSDETPQRLDLGFWGRGQLLIEARRGQSWTVDAGARYSRMLMNMATTEKMHLPFVYDFGAAFIPNKTWNFSLRYGRVFRYPTMDEQASYNGYGTASVNTDLNPEYGHSVTASAELRKGRFRAGFAPYFLAMSDEIAYDAAAQTNMNLKSTYHFGQVSTLNWDARAFSAALSYSYDRAQFVDTGKLVPLVPSHTVFTRFAVRPGKRVEISTDARFSSGYYPGGDSGNSQDRIPGRIAWNAGVQWQLPTGFLIKFRVDNILDDRTPTNVYYNSWNSSTSWYPSEGRVFTISAEWRY